MKVKCPFEYLDEDKDCAALSYGCYHKCDDGFINVEIPTAEFIAELERRRPERGPNGNCLKCDNQAHGACLQCIWNNPVNNFKESKP